MRVAYYEGGKMCVSVIKNVPAILKGYISLLLSLLGQSVIEFAGTLQEQNAKCSYRLFDV